jgi:hypothetical protein
LATQKSWPGVTGAWLDAALLFLLTALLIKPLFKLDYLDNWSSIEGTFVSDSRFLRDHLPHPGWQPLWYCGTRFDYIYPPAIRYGPALISRYAHVSVARGHHFYTAVLYALGIVAVYWLFRAGSGSRGGALLAAAGVALISPSFVLMKEVRLDSIFWVPQRLHTLMAYGEGPHISAVCILPAVLAAGLESAAWLAPWMVRTGGAARCGAGFAQFLRRHRAGDLFPDSGLVGMDRRVRSHGVAPRRRESPRWRMDCARCG